MGFKKGYKGKKISVGSGLATPDVELAVARMPNFT
jgi:hypothetical protein